MPTEPTLQRSSYGFSQPIGTDFPLTSSTVLYLLVKPPKGAVIRRLIDPSLFDIPNKSITWEVQQGDLAVVGTYQYQLLDLTAGEQIYSQISRFVVRDNIG